MKKKMMENLKAANTVPEKCTVLECAATAHNYWGLFHIRELIINEYMKIFFPLTQ